MIVGLVVVGTAGTFGTLVGLVAGWVFRSARTRTTATVMVRYVPKLRS